MTEQHTTDETRAKDARAPHPDDARKPASPADLKPVGWKFTAKNAWREFGSDQCTDLAAALTYYTVLALFPGLMALVSLLALFGQSEGGIEQLMNIVRQLAPADAISQIEGPLTQMVNSRGTGLALVIGLLSALWSASGYVGAFGRAMNRVYEVSEGRPVWKLWSIAKWPVMLALVVLLVAVLYHFTPNVRQPKFRWISVGALVAIGVWLVASLAFALYVSSAGNYSKTYGALAGVIVMLLWIWLTNLALLFGAEVDSELERARELQAGMPAEQSLQLPPRDTSGIEKTEKKQAAAEQEAREVRLNSGSSPLAASRRNEKAKQKGEGPDGKDLDEDGFVLEE